MTELVDVSNGQTECSRQIPGRCAGSCKNEQPVEVALAQSGSRMLSTANLLGSPRSRVDADGRVHATSFCPHVRVVVCSGSEEQVGRVHASRVVAAVEDAQSVRDRTDNNQVGRNVRHHRLEIDREPPVALPVEPKPPGSTLVGPQPEYATPETLRRPTAVTPGDHASSFLGDDSSSAARLIAADGSER